MHRKHEYHTILLSTPKLKHLIGLLGLYLEGDCIYMSKLVAALLPVPYPSARSISSQPPQENFRCHIVCRSWPVAEFQPVPRLSAAGRTRPRLHVLA